VMNNAPMNGAVHLTPRMNAPIAPIAAYPA